MQKKNLLIGASPRLLTEDGTLKQFINDNYVEYLQSRGANVIMVCLDNPNINEILDLCDGFLITGGSDINPKYYGANNDLGESQGIKPRLDIVDKQMVDYAKEHKTPVLGICRGHQSINVFMGGTLIQHVDNHRDIANGHEVNGIKNEIMNFDEHIITNSYHHQVVKDPAPTFKVIAKHKDDEIVEALVSTEYPMICIQWHPERLQGSKESNLIIDKFFEFVKEYKH